MTFNLRKPEAVRRFLLRNLIAINFLPACASPDTTWNRFINWNWEITNCNHISCEKLNKFYCAQIASCKKRRNLTRGRTVRVWSLTTYLSCHHMCCRNVIFKRVCWCWWHHQSFNSSMLAHLPSLRLNPENVFEPLLFPPSSRFFLVFLAMENRPRCAVTRSRFLNYAKVFNSNFCLAIAGERKGQKSEL